MYMSLMNKKSFYLLSLLSMMLFVLALEVIYLSMQKSMTPSMLEKKKLFVAVTGLPDLAISTEATYVRHRSLSDLFSIYKDDGSLREYFPSTYAISHSHIINQHTKSSHEE